MELKITEYSLPEQILFNYEELKKELTDKVSMYETLVYTESQIKEAKADKANLNKLKKALNDERIRLEKEYLEPFNEFKTKINEIISIIDKPVAVIDKQVKDYENKKKELKKTDIEQLFETIGFQNFVTLDKIWNEKWLNASVSMKNIEDQMREMLFEIGNDIMSLSKISDFGFEATEIYKSTLDINKAIGEAQRMSEIAKSKAEKEEAMRRAAEELSAKSDVKADEELLEPNSAEYDFNEAETIENHPVTTTDGSKQWVRFQALLSTEDAFALKEFFNSRHIEFKAV